MSLCSGTTVLLPLTWLLIVSYLISLVFAAFGTGTAHDCLSADQLGNTGCLAGNGETSLSSCVYSYAATGEWTALVEVSDVVGTVFKDKLDGLADVGHQLFLGGTLRDSLGQLLALATIQPRGGVSFDDNSVFCHDNNVSNSTAKVHTFSEMANFFSNPVSVSCRLLS